MRSPEPSPRVAAPLRPLFAKELREIVGGRALWTMLLLICPLVGYSFFQATSLYSEASAAARQSPVLAASLSPLDGILVPTFGSFYVAVTLLFPFVAIRVLGQEKESGALRLLVQLPYRSSTLILVKLGAVLAAWVMVSIPALSALAIWTIVGRTSRRIGNAEPAVRPFALRFAGRVRSHCSPQPYPRAPPRRPSSRWPRPSAPGCSISPLPAIQACRLGRAALADADSAPVRAGTSVRSDWCWVSSA